MPAVWLPDVIRASLGNSGTESEAVMAYESGYREQTTEQFSWDIAMFYNVYDHLMTVTPGLMPHRRRTADASDSPYYGQRATGETLWRRTDRATTRCRNGGGSMLNTLTSRCNLQTELPAATESGNDPHNQVYLRSAWDLRENLEFDLMARYVDRLPDLNVPSYITMDLRLAWRPRKHLELAVVGQNLLQAYHWEFAGNIVDSPTYATEVPRGVYGTLTWRR